jgi:hypothetical protein
MRFARQVDKQALDQERTVDLEDVQIWDLVDAFSRLMEAIGRQPGAPQIIYDDTPIELHAADILDFLRSQGETPFERIFEGRTSRGEIVGLFLALLELVRRKKVRAAQDRNFAQITVSLWPVEAEQDGQAASQGTSLPLAEADIAAVATEAVEPPRPGERPKAPLAPSPGNEAAMGQYVSETPGGPGKPKEDDDDDREETEGIGA